MEVNTRCFSENTPHLQFKSQKPKEETNAENQIDRYISINGSIVLSKHQRLSDLMFGQNDTPISGIRKASASFRQLDQWSIAADFVQY